MEREDASSKFLSDLMSAMNQDGDQCSLQKLPVEMFCNEIAAYFDHRESLTILALLSRSFYVSMQYRYKSLCLINRYITERDTQTGDENANMPNQMKNTNSESTKIVNTKNYISIFGKFHSKI